MPALITNKFNVFLEKNTPNRTQTEPSHSLLVLIRRHKTTIMIVVQFDTPSDTHNVDFIHRLFDTEKIENCSPKLCDIFWVIMSLIIALLLGVCACSALRLLDILSECFDECRLNKNKVKQCSFISSKKARSANVHQYETASRRRSSGQRVSTINKLKIQY